MNPDLLAEARALRGEVRELRSAVREAFDYARRTGIRRVQVNNPHVLEDLETGILESGDTPCNEPHGRQPHDYPGKPYRRKPHHRDREPHHSPTPPGAWRR